MGVKFGLSHRGRNMDWRCSRKGYSGRCLGV